MVGSSVSPRTTRRTRPRLAGQARRGRCVPQATLGVCGPRRDRNDARGVGFFDYEGELAASSAGQAFGSVEAAMTSSLATPSPMTALLATCSGRPRRRFQVDWFAAKAFDSGSALGPGVVGASEIPRPDISGSAPPQRRRGPGRRRQLDVPPSRLPRHLPVRRQPPARRRGPHWDAGGGW